MGLSSSLKCSALDTAITASWSTGQINNESKPGRWYQNSCMRKMHYGAQFQLLYLPAPLVNLPAMINVIILLFALHFSKWTKRQRSLELWILITNKIAALIFPPLPLRFFFFFPICCGCYYMAALLTLSESKVKEGFGMFINYNIHRRRDKWWLKAPGIVFPA